MLPFRLRVAARWGEPSHYFQLRRASEARTAHIAAGAGLAVFLYGHGNAIMGAGILQQAFVVSYMGPAVTTRRGDPMLEIPAASANSARGRNSIQLLQRTLVSRHQRGDIAKEFAHSAAHANAVESARTVAA